MKDVIWGDTPCYFPSIKFCQILDWQTHYTRDNHVYVNSNAIDVYTLMPVANEASLRIALLPNQTYECIFSACVSSWGRCLHWYVYDVIFIETMIIDCASRWRSIYIRQMTHNGRLTSLPPWCMYVSPSAIYRQTNSQLNQGLNWEAELDILHTFYCSGPLCWRRSGTEIYSWTVCTILDTLSICYDNSK